MDTIAPPASLGLWSPSTVENRGHDTRALPAHLGHKNIHYTLQAAAGGLLM
jgi:hypothetical protein